MVTENVALKLLADGLQEAATQLLPGDIEKIAAKLNKTVYGIRPYFKGDVKKFNTGSILLKETRRFIRERENEVRKLVA